MNITKFLRKQSIKDARGQSLVEMTLGFTVILYLLLGAVEFSLALFQYVTMRDAAQEGAIYASIKPTDAAGIRDRAIAAASDVLVMDEANVSVNLVVSDYCEGLSDSGVPNAIQIEIAYPHEIFLPLVTPMIGTDTINLKANVTNTILQPMCE